MLFHNHHLHHHHRHHHHHHHQSRRHELKLWELLRGHVGGDCWKVWYHNDYIMMYHKTIKYLGTPINIFCIYSVNLCSVICHDPLRYITHLDKIWRDTQKIVYEFESKPIASRVSRYDTKIKINDRTVDFSSLRRFRCFLRRTDLSSVLTKHLNHPV